MLALILLALLLFSTVLGQPGPLTPANGMVGSTCQINWTPDTTGTWKLTNIELMTGSNFAMVHITTVATVDTTSKAAPNFTYPCPNVMPNADIYWYQFSHAAQPANLLWTTRFPIVGSAGQITAPQYNIQPDNKTAVPWGTGNLVDPTLATAAPSYIVGQTSESVINNMVTPATANVSATADPSVSTTSAPMTPALMPIGAGSTELSSSGDMNNWVPEALALAIVIAFVFGHNV